MIDWTANLLIEKFKDGHYFIHIYYDNNRCTRCEEYKKDCKLSVFLESTTIVYRCKDCQTKNIRILDEKELFLLRIHNLI